MHFFLDTPTDALQLLITLRRWSVWLWARQAWWTWADTQASPFSTQAMLALKAKQSMTAFNDDACKTVLNYIK